MSRPWFVCIPLLFLAGSVAAATLRVPSDYPTIRRAVFEAAAGDTVLVAAGTYFDRFTISGKNLVLRGENVDATIVNGSMVNNEITPGNVITVTDVDRSMIIEDLTITGGTFNSAAVESTGAAIYANRAHPTIQRCKLTGNDANSAGGVAAYFFARPLVRDCLIADNVGGGIFVETDTGLQESSAAEIYNNTIVRNQGYGVAVIKGARAIVESCTIAYNLGDGVLSEITTGTGDAKCYVTVRRSIISHNTSGGIVRGATLGTCYTLECNDVWGNAGVTDALEGNYRGYFAQDPCFRGRGTGDVSFDPMYQDASGGNYQLSPQSPLFLLCEPGSCGALGAGTKCTDTVRASTWSEVKSRFR